MVRLELDKFRWESLRVWWYNQRTAPKVGKQTTEMKAPQNSAGGTKDDKDGTEKTKEESHLSAEDLPSGTTWIHV